jgi:hypothetical protein
MIKALLPQRGSFMELIPLELSEITSRIVEIQHRNGSGNMLSYLEC